MTSYQPGQDFFARDTSSAPDYAGHSFRNELRITNVPNRKLANGTVIDNSRVRAFEMIFHSLGGGLGAVTDVARSATIYRSYLDRFSTSSLVTDSPGSLSLPQLSTVDTVKHAGTTVNVTVSCNIFGVLAVANGGTANQSLAKDTGAGALTQITYSPGSAITALAPVIIGGVGTAQQLFVGKAGAAAQILSDLTTGGPTSAGTMHANTTACTGVITSPLNSTTVGASTLMMLANQGLYLQGTETAIGAAPTATLTNVPRGGYWSGIVSLPSVPLRAYAVIPDQDAGAQSMFVSTARPGKLVSFNLEGTDPQDIKLPTIMGRVLWSFPWFNSVIVSDGFSIYQVDSTIHDLHVISAEDKNYSDFYQVMGGYTYGGNLYAWIVKYNQIAATATMSLRRYQPATNSWHQTSADIALTNSASNFPILSTTWVQPCAPMMPVSDAGWVQMPKLATTNYYVHQFQTLPGYEPFYMYNGTAADIASGYGVAKEPSGSVTGPSMAVDGLEGYPGILEEVAFMGDVAAGGTTATVKYDFALQSGTTLAFSNNKSVTFSATDPALSFSPDGSQSGANWVRWPDNRDIFSRFRMKITLTQGSDTRQTPNGLPGIVRGLIFLDRKVRSPMEVWGY